MATILRAYSWESGNIMAPDVDEGGAGVATTDPHTGSYHAEVGNAGVWNAWVRFPIPGSVSTPSVSVWLYNNKGFDATPSSDTDGLAVNYELGDGKLITLRWNGSTHTFDAFVDGTLVASGTVEVSVIGWFHLQFYVVVSDTGSIQVKIDGHESINYSGDTKPGTSDVADYVYFRGPSASYGTHNGAFIDDLVIGSGGYLGDLRCYDLRPSADTAQADWTPSIGTDHYALLDETPEDDADYVSTTNTGDADELDLTDFDASDKTPKAVTAWVRAKADDAVGAQLKVGVDSGGTDDTETVDLSTAWEYYFHTMDNDPNTSSEWTDSGVDALKLRYEAVIS